MTMYLTAEKLHEIS